MWNLKPLEVVDYREHLDIAFPPDLIPPALTEEEKNALIELYELYKERLGRPCAELVGEEVRQESRQRVHDAYEFVQDGRRLGALRAAIKLLAESCPYCGYGPIEALDHLLQRGQYKLFSIFPLNLIPSCGLCNGGKRKKTSANATEHQIHVYLEDVSEYSFLRTEVTVDAVSGGLKARYFIEQSPAMPDDVYQRLLYHLIEFDLQARYERQINIFLGEQAYGIELSFESGGAEGLREYLLGSARTLEKRFGTNDWRTALMFGLSACAEFWEGGFKTALGRQPAIE